MKGRELGALIHQGYRNLSRHPCSICGMLDYTFAEFPHFHGTDFGKCPRAVEYEKISWEEKVYDDKTLVFLADGHIHEAATARAMRAAGLKVDHRTDAHEGVMEDEFTVIFRGSGEDGKILKFSNPLDAFKKKEGDDIVMVGHTDGIIQDVSTPNSEKFIFEHKAVKDWSFNNKWKKGIIPGAYYGQTQAYITAHELSGGFLVCKNRSTGEILEPILVPRDDKFVWGKVEIFREVLKAINDKRWLPCTTNDPDEKRWCEACKAVGDM